MMRFLFTLCAVFALAATTSAETITTTDGVSYTRASDGNFYRTELFRPRPATPPPTWTPPTYAPPLWYAPTPGGCPGGKCPVPPRRFE